MKQETSLIKRMMFATAPLVLFVVAWSSTSAQAQSGWGIVAAITTISSYVTETMGLAASTMNTAQAGFQTFQSDVLYPVQQANQIRSTVTGTVSAYRGWMDQVTGLNTNSATMSMTTGLESLTRGGANVSSPQQISAAYHSTYGDPVPTNGASPYLRNVTDMSDAQVMDALSLASATDSAALDMIAQSHAIEDRATWIAPGIAPTVSLQGRGLQLQAMAVHHKLLAARLRLEATQLANVNAEIKQKMSNQVPSSTFLPLFNSQSSGPSSGAALP